MHALDEAFRVLKPEGVMLMTVDSFDEYEGDRNAVTRDDGSIVFVKGPYKGMLVRPYREDELALLPEKGWKILKDEITPRRSKILLLQKSPIGNASQLAC
jgi:ubiquinone/menaquinone biosynthesis C-methylase UbiE